MACNEARNETEMAFEGINFYGILKECPPYEEILKLKKEFKNIDYDESYLHSEQNIFRKKMKKNINRKSSVFPSPFCWALSSCES